MALSTAVKMIILAAKGWPPRGVDDVLWRAEFLASYAAPLTSPHTATDDGGVHSVGQAVLTDAESLLYTSTGALQIPAQATPAWGDMTLVAQDGAGGDFSQEIGRAVAINLAVTTGGDLFAGYSNSKTPGTSLAGYYGLRWKAAGALYLQDGVTETEIGSYTPSVEHAYIVLTRPTGLFLLQDDKLIYIHDTAYTAPFPFVSNYDAAGFMAVGNLVDLSTDIPGIYPVPQLSDTFDDAPPIIDHGSNGINAVANSVGLGQADGSDGYVFNGIDSFIQLDAAGLEAAGWDDATGAIIVEFASTEADAGGIKNIVHIGSDNSNNVRVVQNGTLIVLAYEAGNVQEQQTVAAPVVINNVYRVGIMWAEGDVRFYLDGLEVGMAQPIAGTWAGTITDAFCQIGRSAPVLFFGGRVINIPITLGVAPSHANMLTLTDQSTPLTTANLDALIGPGAYADYNGSERNDSDGRAHVEGPLGIGASDGSGVPWVLGTWSQAAALLSNAPVAGAELLTNGDFSAWTGGNPDGWTVTGEVGTDPEVSEVDSGQGHGGTNVTGGNANFYTSVGLNIQADQAGVTASGVFYVRTVIIDAIFAGEFRVFGVGSDKVITAPGTTVYTGRADGTPVGLKRQGGGVEVNVTISDDSLKSFNFADLITGNPDFTLRYPNIRSAVPTAANRQTGVTMRLDTLTNPTTGYLIYCDFNDNTIRVIDIAANSEIATWSITPNDGATLAAWLLDDNILRVQYDGGAVNTVAVTPDSDALLYGAFNTGGDDGASVGLQAWDTGQFNAPGGLL